MFRVVSAPLCFGGFDVGWYEVCGGVG